jgi:predicted CXXCH cytochrome family protein
MKHYLSYVSLIVVFLMLFFCQQQSMAAIKLKNTPHDLSKEGNVAQICQTCHISNGNNSQINSLLAKGVNEQEYSSIQDILGLSSSLFCAQCHDGSISVRVINNADYGAANSGGYSLEGRTRDNNHPVNIAYPHSQSFKINPDLKFYGASEDQIKCNTCHDPHKAGVGSFLRMKKGLCVECHIK